MLEIRSAVQRINGFPRTCASNFFGNRVDARRAGTMITGNLEESVMFWNY